MPLKIGSLYVSLTAQTGEFAKGMQGALKAVERFSKEVKKAAGDAMGIGASLTAVGAGALKLASDVSGPTKRALDELSASTKQLAVPIAEALVPAVREASNVIRGIGQAFKELSPETKAAVVTVLQVGAAMTAVGGVVGKLAGTVNLLAGVFSGVFGAIAAIGIGPLLGIVAAIGVVIGAVALLHRAWRQNWGNIQETTAAVVEAIKEQFASLVQVVGKLFDWLVDQVATMVDTNLQLVERLQKAFGVQIVDTRGLRAGFQGLFADLKSGEFFNQALQFGKTVGKQIGSGLLEEWKLIGKELGLDDILAKVKGITAGAALTVGPRAAARPVVSGAMAMRDPREVNVRAILDLAKEVRRRGPTRISQTSAVGGETARRNFEQFQERETAARAASAQGTKDSLGNTAQQFVAKLGELGTIIQNVAQAASQGGPWAALAAAISELLTRTRAFVELLMVAAGGLSMVTDALEGGASVLFDGLGQVLVTALQAVGAAVKMVEPALVGVGEVLMSVAPLFLPLGAVFKALTPLIEILTGSILGILKILDPIVAVLQIIIIGVGIAIAWTLKQLGAIWNAIVNEIANIIDTVLSIITAGVVKDGGKFVRDLSVNVTPAAEALRDLNEQAKAMGLGTQNVWEILSNKNGKQAAADLAAQFKQTADSAQAVSEAFLNVPTGYKVARARFAADSGGLTQFTMPGDAAAGSGVTINGDITVVTNDPAEFMEQLRRVEFRHTGAVAANLTRNVR